MELKSEIKKVLDPRKHLVKRPAKGILKHDYLVPNGVYEEQWDWDAFFIGMSLASEIPSEAIYLKNWTLNYCEHVKPNGFTPGLLTPEGMDKRLRHVKPLIAQGAYYATLFLKEDFQWLKPIWGHLKKMIAYRENTYRDKETGLICWYNGMESGADNNPSILFFKEGTSIATDLNAFLFMEYKAMAKIASRLGMKKEAILYSAKATNLAKMINRYLWNEKDKTYYHLDTKTRKHIKHMPHSVVVPLWAGLASPQNAKEMIKKYVLNPKKLWAKWGVRSLSADDKYYNNANILKPHSNWQGPIWINFNYMVMHALLHYGFKTEAKQIAEKMAKLCIMDVEKNGIMHENYDADTGEPLAAPDFVSWNLLANNMLEETETGKSIFSLAVGKK